MDIRKLDPDFVDYEPTTGVEAIKLFYKQKRLGHIHWDDVDAVFRKLARGLDQKEFEVFVGWMANPTGVQPGTLADCFPKSGHIPREESTPKHLDQVDEKCPV